MPQEFLPFSYIYMNAFVLAFGVWGIIKQESTDAISMVSIATNVDDKVLFIVSCLWLNTEKACKKCVCNKPINTGFFWFGLMAYQSLLVI